MDSTLEVFTSRLRKEQLTNADLQDSQAAQWILAADSRIRMSRDLADRFRKRAVQFNEQQRSSDSLHVIREAVDRHLPWQAGRDLCEALDCGLLDVTGFPHESRCFDLRILSPEWCSRILAGLESNDGRLSRGISQPTVPQLFVTLRSVIDQYASKPQEARSNIDNLVVSSTWWSFLRNVLTKTEAYATRLGPDVAMHWQFVDVLEGMAAGNSCSRIADVKPFNGESSEDQLLLRLRTAARLQAEACEIVAEHLDAIAGMESEELLAHLERQVTTDSEPAPETPGFGELCFYFEGEHVRICGLGENVSLKPSEGVERLAQIVCSKSQCADAMALSRIGAGQQECASFALESFDAASERISPNLALESPLAGAPDDVREAVQQLIDQKKFAVANGDEDKVAMLSSQINAALGTTQTDVAKARKSVKNSLDRTYQRIRKAGGDKLAKYFEQSISCPRSSPEFIYAMPNEETKQWIRK